MSAFPAPIRYRIIFLALCMTGNVIVTLSGGGLGESLMGATHRDLSLSRGWFGKREHVCPSGPSPSRRESNRGQWAWPGGRGSLNSYGK